jgi:hypothetical protein
MSLFITSPQIANKRDILCSKIIFFCSWRQVKYTLRLNGGGIAEIYFHDKYCQVKNLSDYGRSLKSAVKAEFFKPEKLKNRGFCFAGILTFSYKKWRDLRMCVRKEY